MTLPKDAPIKDKELLGRVAALIHRCEWPLGCSETRYLDIAHIRAKGMGGGRRKDTEDNLVRLCRNHHREYDQRMGQSPENQLWLKQALEKRPQWVRDAIRRRS